MYIFLSTWRVILYFKEVVTIKAFLESLKNFLDSKVKFKEATRQKQLLSFFLWKCTQTEQIFKGCEFNIRCCFLFGEEN